MNNVFKIEVNDEYHKKSMIKNCLRLTLKQYLKI